MVIAAVVAINVKTCTLSDAYEENGELRAFEFKWNARKGNAKCPESFQTAYPTASYQVITPENVEEFLL